MIKLSAVPKQIAVSVPVLILVLQCTLTLGTSLGSAQDAAQHQSAAGTPTFYRDVLPILQQRCQICHRAEGIAPTRFESFEQTRPYAAAIATATQNRSMPPWFAD